MDDNVLLWFSPTYNRIQINVARPYKVEMKWKLNFYEKNSIILT